MGYRLVSSKSERFEVGRSPFTLSLSYRCEGAKYFALKGYGQQFYFWLYFERVGRG